MIRTQNCYDANKIKLFVLKLDLRWSWNYGTALVCALCSTLTSFMYVPIEQIIVDESIKSDYPDFIFNCYVNSYIVFSNNRNFSCAGVLLSLVLCLHMVLIWI